MIRSGIVPIDELCEGFRPRSTYIVTGGAGAGKTSCGLQFLDQGLRCGEAVFMLTHASRQDLLTSADVLGIELRAAIRDERAVILRYRPDFSRRLVRAGTADPVFAELRRLVLQSRPRRLVVDTFAPLLDDGSPSPVAAAALTELMEFSEATWLLTYPDDLAAGYDRRLEPIVQSAAGVFRLARETAGERRVNVVSLRHGTASGVGGLLSPAALAAPSGALIVTSGPLLLLHVSEAPTEDLLATLRLQHEVLVEGAVRKSAPDPRFAALVVETDHTALDAARRLVRSRAGDGRPIVVISRFNLRSLDRARLLREGADEVLAGDMGAPELLQRLATALRRGHLDHPPMAVHEDETVTQASLGAADGPLDRERFAAALVARAAHDDAVPFTVVRLAEADGSAADRRALAAQVLATMRLATGDLAALLDDGVAVYLHGAGRRDVATFVERVRGRRAPGAAALRVESATFPTDGAAVRQLVEPLEVR